MEYPRRSGRALRRTVWGPARSAVSASAAIIGCLFVTVAAQAQTATSSSTSSSTDISPGANSVSTRVGDGFSSFFEGNAQYWNWRGSRGPNDFNPVEGKGSQFYSTFLFGLDYQEPKLYTMSVRQQTGYVHKNNHMSRQP